MSKDSIPRWVREEAEARIRAAVEDGRIPDQTLGPIVYDPDDEAWHFDVRTFEPAEANAIPSVADLLRT